MIVALQPSEIPGNWSMAGTSKSPETSLTIPSVKVWALNFSGKIALGIIGPMQSRAMNLSGYRDRERP